MSRAVDMVAKAIFREGFHADEPESNVAAKWEEWPETRQQSRRKARAAIEAVRPITWDRLSITTEDGIKVNFTDGAADQLWRYLIDTLLTEEEAA